VKLRLALLSLVAAATGLSPAQDRTRHVLKIALDPASRLLTAEDAIALPSAEAEFLLSADLRITRSTPPVQEIALGGAGALLRGSGIELEDAPRLKRYRARAAPDGVLRLEYEGRFDPGASEDSAAPAGTLGPQGIYLPGGACWYPHLGKGFFEFELEIALPEGWHAVSEGSGSSRDDRGVARWRSEGQVERIHLAGGRLRVYRGSADSTETLVYLREEDDPLAARLLAATARTIEMYSGLIGPYPYAKFALVESAFESRHGMPSFTLLGPGGARLPSTIDSSHPHEILHNWWGHSVLVDHESGDWCEGLTAYMADHLLAEQQGQAGDYRRDLLQKYRDHAGSGRDFPLAQLRAKGVAATDVVGHARALMGFHALRLKVGDETFRNIAARFYRDFKGRRASFADFQRTAEAVSGKSLSRFFQEWISRAGAPSIQLQFSGLQRDGAGFEVRGALNQVQGGAPFALDVPVVLLTARGARRQVIRLEQTHTPFALRSRERPIALLVDPHFDCFRKLDPRETPPSIGQLFGEPRVFAVISSRETPERQQAYRQLLKAWQNPGRSIEIELDAGLPVLPRDRPVWLLGRQNKFAAGVFGPATGVVLEASGITVGTEKLPLLGHSLVLVGRHPRNLEKAVGWILVDPLSAASGLARKLPQNGRYSYVAFKGATAVSVAKGQWPGLDSPLRVDLREAAERGAPLPAPKPEARKPLAELPASPR
jgi:hypothetical protein